MGIGFSSSSTTNIQQQKQQILQDVSTQCTGSWSEDIDNLRIDVSNSYLPNGISVKQTHAVDGQCVLDNGAQALAKLIQSSTATTQAQNASKLLGINFDDARSMTLQQLETSIQQSVKSQCNFQVSETMTNVTIGVTNSTVGDIFVNQDDSNSKTTCAISALLNANATAGQDASSSTTSGGTSLKSLLIIAGVVVVVLIIAGVAFAMFRRSQKSKTAQKGKGKGKKGKEGKEGEEDSSDVAPALTKDNLTMLSRLLGAMK